MTDFWFLTLALLVLALSFVFMPVFMHIKKQTNTDEGSSVGAVNVEFERQKQNVLIFKERLEELEQEYAQGKHQQESFNQLKSELETSLLVDTDFSQTENNASKNNNTGPILGLKNIIVIALSAVVVVAVSYGSYFKFGAYDKVIQTTAMRFDDQEIKQAKASAEQGDMSALLDQLYHKLKQAPDNIEGWRLLARSAMNTESYDLAIEAYTQIIRIFDATDESTAVVYGLLAQAHYYKSQGQMTESVQNALDQAFEQNPNEVNSLGLIAIDAFVKQEYKVAIEHWQKILEAAPDHPSKISIETGIQRAQMALGEPLSATQQKMTQMTEVSKENSAKASIQVEVTIAPEVLANVNANDTVFIFAKAPAGKGPTMPLAARKLRVSELPVTIVLNDQSAMGPMAKLSQVTHANVIARVSKSGQPIAQPGDYEGQQEGVDVFANASIRIEITDKKN